VDGAGPHHLDGHALAQPTVDDPDQHDDAQVGIVPAIYEQGLERRRLVALRGRQAMHDGFQHLVDAEPGLRRDLHRLRGIEPDHLLDLFLDAVGLGRRQVDLVEDGHDLVICVERLVDVGERLRLDALRRVDDEERTLAGGKRARNFVGEIDVPGRVHQVQDIILPVPRLVFEAHGLRLDGDAALLLDVHRVEHLLRHVAERDGPGLLDEAVRKRRLAVIDMRDDREVANVVDGVRGHGARGAALARIARRLGAGAHWITKIGLQRR
jgi:hypothetical protein